MRGRYGELVSAGSPALWNSVRLSTAINFEASRSVIIRDNADRFSGR
jgi:hypothetical protein